MKCKYCGQNFRTSAEDRIRNRNSGDFSPRYWQNEYSLTDDEVSEIGFDPKDNDSFICYDCDQKFFDKQQSKAAASRKDWEDENGNVVFKLNKPTFKEGRIYPKKAVALDEQLFEDHLLAIGFQLVYSNKYRYVYITPGEGNYYLIVNRPGFDGTVYQMYLIDAKEIHKAGLTIDDFKPRRVFTPETTVGMVAVYEALASSFTEKELAEDMAEIEMLINSKKVTLGEAYLYGRRPRRYEITNEDLALKLCYIRPADCVAVGDTIVDAYEDGTGLEFKLTKVIKDDYKKTVDGGPGQRVFQKHTTWYETDDPSFVVKVVYDTFMEEETIELFSYDYLQQEGIEI